MEIYKGIATFSGIAIGKVLYYSRGEYQIRQCLVSNIKKEISNFQEARIQAVQKLNELYEASRLLNEQEAGVFMRQIKLLESESYQNAIESSIASEKVNAAYAVMINRDELVETFRHLEEPVIRRRINDMQEISNRLIQILGGAAIRINLGDEPVILRHCRRLRLWKWTKINFWLWSCIMVQQYLMHQLWRKQWKFQLWSMLQLMMSGMERQQS